MMPEPTYSNSDLGFKEYGNTVEDDYYLIDGRDLLIWIIGREDSIKYRQIITVDHVDDSFVEEELDEDEYIDQCHTLYGHLGIEIQLKF